MSRAGFRGLGVNLLRAFPPAKRHNRYLRPIHVDIVLAAYFLRVESEITNSLLERWTFISSGPLCDRTVRNKGR